MQDHLFLDKDSCVDGPETPFFNRMPFVKAIVILPFILKVIFSVLAALIGTFTMHCNCGITFFNLIIIAGATFNWFFAFLVVYFYPMTESAINKYVCYFFFAVICFMGALFIILFVPETKGKTEEDMSQYFRQKTNKKNPQDNANGGYED